MGNDCCFKVGACLCPEAVEKVKHHAYAKFVAEEMIGQVVTLERVEAKIDKLVTMVKEVQRKVNEMQEKLDE
jgi:hypothetical protein